MDYSRIQQQVLDLLHEIFEELYSNNSSSTPTILDYAAERGIDPHNLTVKASSVMYLLNKSAAASARARVPFVYVDQNGNIIPNQFINRGNNPVAGGTGNSGGAGETTENPVAGSSSPSGSSSTSSEKSTSNSFSSKRKMVHESDDDDGSRSRSEDDDVVDSVQNGRKADSKRKKCMDPLDKRIRDLGKLIPNCNKDDEDSILEEAGKYLKNLQRKAQDVYNQQMMRPPWLQHPLHLAYFPPFGTLDLNGGLPNVRAAYFPTITNPTNGFRGRVPHSADGIRWFHPYLRNEPQGSTPNSTNGVQGRAPTSTNGVQGSGPISTNGVQGSVPISNNGVQGLGRNLTNVVQGMEHTSTNGVQGSGHNSTTGVQGMVPNSTNGIQGSGHPIVNPTLMPYLIVGPVAANTGEQGIIPNSTDGNPTSLPYLVVGPVLSNLADPPPSAPNSNPDDSSTSTNETANQETEEEESTSPQMNF